MLVCFVCDIVPYQEGTTLQLCRTAAAVGNTMCAWRVLAMLRRVACVGACHNLSPHHTTRFCCAAALGARVRRC